MCLELDTQTAIHLLTQQFLRLPKVPFSFRADLGQDWGRFTPLEAFNALKKTRF